MESNRVGAIGLTQTQRMTPIIALRKWLKGTAPSMPAQFTLAVVVRKSRPKVDLGAGLIIPCNEQAGRYIDEEGQKITKAEYFQAKGYLDAHHQKARYWAQAGDTVIIVPAEKQGLKGFSIQTMDGRTRFSRFSREWKL